MSKRRKFNSTFKVKVVKEALKEKKTLLDLAQEFQISPTQITKWKSQVVDNLSTIFDSKNKKPNPTEDVEALYSQIGKLQMQLDFLKKKTGIDFD